jgi:hypothetical protein
MYTLESILEPPAFAPMPIETAITAKGILKKLGLRGGTPQWHNTQSTVYFSSLPNMQHSALG